MAQLIKRYLRNTKGIDYCVGDVHGSFSLLEEKLIKIGFDKTKDRLFQVGDLVNRGPESHLFANWLKEPWFHAVRGNHEQACIWYIDNQVSEKELKKRGGHWLTNKIDKNDYRLVRKYLDELPYVIEVETENGLIGIVHANILGYDWEDFKTSLICESTSLLSQPARSVCLWDNSRFNNKETTPVNGVRAVITGHNRTTHPVILGNVYHIDTGASMGGHFTIINLNQLTTL